MSPCYEIMCPLHFYFFLFNTYLFNHQVRDSDPKDPKRDSIVQLIDDFRVTGVNGERILYKDGRSQLSAPQLVVFH